MKEVAGEIRVKAWKKTKLEDCCEIVGGSTPSTSVDAYWDGEICWATPKDLSELEGAQISKTPRKLTQAGLDACAAVILPVGSVLFSSRAPIGHVAVNTVPMATNQGFKSFIPKQQRVEAKFLYWWLRTNRSYLEGLGNGATFKEVSKAIVSRIEVPLLPLTEQRRIAEVLDRGEALRTKRRAALAQLDILSQRIFFELFGDPTTNSKKWSVAKLGDLCEDVIDCPHSTPIYSAERTPYPCVRSSDIQNGSLDFSHAKFVERSEYDRRVLRGKPRRGDVIYCREGARFGNAARVVDDTSLCLGRRMMLFRPKASAAVSDYLWGFLSGPAGYREATKSVDGSASPHVNIKEIVAFRLPAPPLSLQHDFARRVAAVDRLKTAHRTSLAGMDALFVTLQHRAFRGEL